MTRHVTEDTVLKLALGLLDSPAERRVRSHLVECTRCSGLMEEANRAMRVLKEVSPQVTAEIPVLPSLRLNRLGWLRMAAMLAVGFGLGFLASESFRPPTLTVVQQQLVPRPPEKPAVGFVACENVDLFGSFR